MKNIILNSITLSFLFLCSAWADEAKVYRCKSTLFTLLHQYESKSKESLEIFEFKHGKNTREIFDDHSLKMVNVSLTKEIFGVYRRPAIARGARGMFSDVRVIGDVADEDFVKLLKPNTYYTYVLDDEKIVFAPTRPGTMRDFASKHAILRDQSKDLRLAGEMWVDKKGVFHFDGSSGTFMPPNKQTEKGLKFFKDELGIKNAEVHLFDPKTFQAPGPFPDQPLPAPVPKKPLTFPVPAVKFSAAPKLVAQIVDGQKIRLHDEKGNDVEYMMIKEDSSTTKELILNKTDLALHRTNEKDRTIASASKLAENSQGIEERKTEQFVAYPVVNGKVMKEKPGFSVSVTHVQNFSPKGNSSEKPFARIEGNSSLVEEFSREMQN